jgi:hypothetical protein
MDPEDKFDDDDIMEADEVEDWLVEQEDNYYGDIADEGYDD